MAVKWRAKMDPADVIDYTADFAGGPDPVLASGEVITSYTVIPDPTAAAHGLRVRTDGDYAHKRVNGNTAILMFLEVDPLQQQHADFVDGIPLDVIVQIISSSTPPRTRERTFTVTVKQL